MLIRFALVNYKENESAKAAIDDLHRMARNLRCCNANQTIGIDRVYIQVAYKGVSRNRRRGIFFRFLIFIQVRIYRKSYLVFPVNAWA